MKKFFVLFFLNFLFFSNILNAEEKTTVRVNDDLKNEMKLISEEKLIERSNPISTEEANTAKKNYDEWQRKTNTPYKTPEPKNRTIPISFKTGEKPENIYMAANYSTTLILLDKLGNQWPITKAITGDPESFIIDSIPPSTLIITPQKIYKKTNLTLIIEGINVPAILSLNSNSDIVDYKVEAIIDDFGPNSKDILNNKINIQKTSSGYSQSTNPYSEFPEKDITLLVNGEIPEMLKGREKETTGYNNITVYEYNEKLYILTDAIVKSPAPIDARSGATENNLFITMALPFIFLIKDGELIKVLVKD